MAEEPQQWELAGVQLPDGVSNMLNTVKAFTVEGNPYDRGIFYKEYRCDDGNKVKSYDCIPAVCICDTDFISGSVENCIIKGTRAWYIFHMGSYRPYAIAQRYFSPICLCLPMS